MLGPLACGDNPIAPDDFGGQFRVVWNDFDVTYPFFPVKGIDWDSIRAVYEPQALTASSDSEWFDLLSEMLVGLEDGHVRLTTPFGTVSYTGWYDRFPANYDPALVPQGYFDGSLTPASAGRLGWGTLPGGIVYVHIPSWSGTGHGGDMDEVLDATPDAIGYVLDVRDNSGGNDLNGKAVAGRFADRTRLFRRVQFRNGPAHDDYTTPEEDFVQPAGSRSFSGPVVVLTNRRVFSSSEAFVLAMRVLPTVTVVGDTTGGGSANPAERMLPNGWTYTVSRWLVTTPEGVPFEGTGLAPDVPVSLDPVDAAEGRDTILERAIELLEARVGAAVSGGDQRTEGSLYAPSSSGHPQAAAPVTGTLRSPARGGPSPERPPKEPEASSPSA